MITDVWGGKTACKSVTWRTEWRRDDNVKINFMELHYVCATLALFFSQNMTACKHW